MNITTYIIINFLLFFSWYVFLFRHKERLSFADRIISTFVLGLAQIILTEMLLGIVFKKLFPVPLFILNFFTSASVLIYAISSIKREFAASENNYIKLFFMSIVGEIQVAVVRFITIIKSDLILLSLFILFLISLCWTIFLGYLFPSYTWDALWYHLPIVGYIMQSGAIQEVPNHSFIDQFINIFPKNIELFFLWNIIFLQSDVVVDLVQLLFSVIGVFTIYSIAVKLKIKEKYAIYSSLLFFFTPVVVLQTTTNYVDVAVSVLFLIAVNFLMSNNPEVEILRASGGKEPISDREIKSHVVLAGLTTGILLGSKGSGLLFVVVLSGVIIIQEIVRHMKLCKAHSSCGGHLIPGRIRHCLINFFAPVFFLGSYWYIKNWIVYNNPVYPMEVSIFHMTLFKGLYGGIIDPMPDALTNLSYGGRLLYVWLENVQYYLYDSRLSGFGPLWFILLLPATAFSFTYAVVKKRYNFLSVSMIFICTFFISIRNWNPRYVIFIVALGAISFGSMLDLFYRRKVLSLISLLLVAYTLIVSNSPCITPMKIREFVHLPAKERTISRLAPFNIDLQARQEYGQWIWISNNVAGGETLAYTFEPLFLSPLWNSEFSSKIAYIKKPDNYNVWLKKLTESNAAYVLIRQSSEEDKWIEKERKIFSSVGWMGAAKEKFKIVYTDENYKIVKVMKNEG